MTKIVGALVISAVLCISGAAAADDPKASQDELAIRKSIESYVELYNRADTNAMASQWSREGEYRALLDGQQAKGPVKIKEALAAFFKENEGIRLKATVTEVHIQAPDRAVSKGIAVYEGPGQPPEETGFVAAHIREDGSWKLLSVEEDESSATANSYTHLKELAWLVGEWVDQDEDATVETVFQWTKNYSFISGSFRVVVQDRVSLEGTQVIGWDPVEKHVRSWTFDSTGSFGHGIWSREGDRWLVRMSSVLGTGEKGSAVNIYTPVDPNTFTWQSIGREVGGELLPNIDEVTIARKQPQTK